MCGGYNAIDWSNLHREVLHREIDGDWGRLSHLACCLAKQRQVVSKQANGRKEKSSVCSVLGSAGRAGNAGGAGGKSSSGGVGGERGVRSEERGFADFCG